VAGQILGSASGSRSRDEPQDWRFHNEPPQVPLALPSHINQPIPLSLRAWAGNVAHISPQPHPLDEDPMSSYPIQDDGDLFGSQCSSLGGANQGQTLDYFSHGAWTADVPQFYQYETQPTTGTSELPDSHWLALAEQSALAQTNQFLPSTIERNDVIPGPVHVIAVRPHHVGEAQTKPDYRSNVIQVLKFHDDIEAAH
jgi:hypothetical protein